MICDGEPSRFIARPDADRAVTDPQRHPSPVWAYIADRCDADAIPPADGPLRADAPRTVHTRPILGRAPGTPEVIGMSNHRPALWRRGLVALADVIDRATAAALPAQTRIIDSRPILGRLPGDDPYGDVARAKGASQ